MNRNSPLREVQMIQLISGALLVGRMGVQEYGHHQVFDPLILRVVHTADGAEAQFSEVAPFSDIPMTTVQIHPDQTLCPPYRPRRNVVEAYEAAVKARRATLDENGYPKERSEAPLRVSPDVGAFVKG